MARAKLTDPEKQEILRLFKESDITATKLAEQFGVSISTISRLLKTELSPAEYTTLSANRRKAGTFSETTTESSETTTLDLFENAAVVASETIAELPIPIVPKAVPVAIEAAVVVLEPLEVPIPRRRRRSSAAQETPVVVEEIAVETPVVSETLQEITEAAVEEIPEEIPAPEQPVRSRILKKSERVVPPQSSESSERLEAPLAELEAEFAASPGQFAAEDFDDDEDFDEEEEDDGGPLEPELTPIESALPVEVLPFSSAEFPRTCWVMVDRASELLTRPLRDFSNIGTIPDTEREAVTLPIFENHRLARRYSSNYHRPLRLPVHLLSSTRPYLLRKGITRLLVGTQVYALDLAEDAIEAEEPVL